MSKAAKNIDVVTLTEALNEAEDNTKHISFLAFFQPLYSNPKPCVLKPEPYFPMFWQDGTMLTDVGEIQHQAPLLPRALFDILKPKP